MEANIVVKAEDLTNDFADGLRKIFSPSALLHIKVEYELNEASMGASRQSSASTSTPAKAAPTGKKRGRKPKPKPEVTEGPKKRGPKPKNPVE